MTREEAKGSLIAIKNKYLANYGEDSIINILIDEYDIQAIDVAIQALEQEPCEDAISRQAVLEHREILRDEQGTGYQAVKTKYIRQLPPIKPQKPKAVLYSGDGYADGYMVYDMAECPNCSYEYEYGDKDWGLPFCPNCGQKLNWESEEV